MNPASDFGHVPLAVSTRGGLIENVHYGSIAVADATGRLLHSAGNPGLTTFTRSALKAFQALPFLRDRGPEAFGFGTREVALLTASHSGEDFHAEGVQRMLDAAGNAPARLRCGCHVPYFYDATGQRPPPEAVIDVRRHNCSGKHAGFLAWCSLHEAPHDTYLEIDHPLQVRLRAEVGALLGVAPEAIPVGIDGCSAPNLALPLTGLARLWAMVAAGGADAQTDSIFSSVFDAMTTHPEYVSGTARSDLLFSRAGGGDWVAKAGADGVQTLGIRSRGLGIALKIADGHARARETVAVEVLRALGLPGAEDPALAGCAKIPIVNLMGVRTGELRPVFTLIDH